MPCPSSRGSSWPPGSPSAASSPAAAPPGKCWTSPHGRCLLASSVGGSTTSSRRRSPTSARVATPGTPCGSGRAGWASGAPSRLGCLGAWIGCRRHGVAFADFADAVAPGYLVAQAMGRLGNWFNNEIYGPPTDLPWGLQIYQWDQQAGHAVLDSAGNPIVKGVFHPTFLYELLWCLLVAGLLIALERRRSFRPGQVFAAFVVVGYPARPILHRADPHRRCQSDPRPTGQHLGLAARPGARSVPLPPRRSRRNRPRRCVCPGKRRPAGSGRGASVSAYGMIRIKL
jgi:hypothetical protein